MANRTSIEWTESTWNPVTGCSKVSPGCKFCYAEMMALRLKAMGVVRYKQGFAVRMHPDLVDRPKSWKSPRTVFVNSMADLFHEEVSDDFIQLVFKTMSETPQHTYQILTKRSERLSQLAPKLSWCPNVWMGVSIENGDFFNRIEDLARVPAAVRFLSIEPLLGPITALPLAEIDWVIVGGESGRTPRPMLSEWVRDIRDQCLSARVPFFFKQWGGRNKKAAGRDLDGRTWSQLPSFS